MDSSRTIPTADFSGFLDGFQARNMVAIERTAMLQLSEIQTRLRLLRAAGEVDDSTTAILPVVKLAEEKFRDPSENIFTRLGDLGIQLQKLIMEYPAIMIGNSKINEQINGIILRYVEAAEISHTDALLASALRVAESYTKINSPL